MTRRPLVLQLINANTGEHPPHGTPLLARAKIAQRERERQSERERERERERASESGRERARQRES